MVDEHSIGKTRERGLLTQQSLTDFENVYDRYYPQIYKYALYQVHHEAIADDITAQTFEAALADWASYDPARGTRQAWLFGIARNRVANHFRKKTRFSPLRLLPSQPDIVPDPEQTIIRNERRAALIRALAKLSSRDREVIALKFSTDLTNRAIGEMVGLSESNVGVIIYRSLKRLRVFLEET